MIELAEDTTLDVIENLIAEAEARRAELMTTIEIQARCGEDTTATGQKLDGIKEALAALYCRRGYLKAMQTQP